MSIATTMGSLLCVNIASVESNLKDEFSYYKDKGSRERVDMFVVL